LGTLNHGWSCCSFLDLRPTEVCKVEPLAVTTQSCRKAWFSHAPQPRVCFGHAFELLGIIGSLVVLHGIVALKGHSKKSNSSSPSTHVGGLWHALMQKCAKSIVYEVWSWKVATNYPDPLWRLLQTRQIYTQLNWFITLYFSVTPSFLGNIEPLWTIYTHQSWYPKQNWAINGAQPVIAPSSIFIPMFADKIPLILGLPRPMYSRDITWPSDPHLISILLEV
jgi:hypothetical protein